MNDAEPRGPGFVTKTEAQEAKRLINDEMHRLLQEVAGCDDPARALALALLVLNVRRRLAEELTGDVSL